MDIVCYATDCLHWYNEITGQEVKKPKEFPNFEFHHIDSLISLEGSPETIRGNVYISDCNSLTSFKGGPKKVFGNLYIDSCEKLESLDDFPEVTGNVSFLRCKSLKSFDVIKSRIGGRLEVKED